MLTRRAAGKLIAGAAATGALVGTRVREARAADKIIKIGITLPLTGAAAEGADRIKYGALLALDQANASGQVKGYRLVPVILNNATTTAGQYDPAQAAVNARKLIAAPEVMAAIGPETSGDGKAMSAILSEASLATVTPSSTNPDLTNPKFASEFRPAHDHQPIYFRTVTTDAYQGPYMANYYYDVLKARSVYVLDDSGAYGVGLADAFEARAKEKGMKVLGHDRLDPMEADYTVALTKISGLKPDSLYFGGDILTAAKLIKQGYTILPAAMPKGGGDGLLQPEMLTSVGFPAAEGWYCTIAAPHLTADPAVEPFVKLYQSTFHTQPSDYAVTAYDAGLIIIGALASLVDTGKPITRANLREAIQVSKTPTLQGTVTFDENGDLTSHTISIFQVVKNTNYPLTDILHQFKYIGTAPTS